MMQEVEYQYWVREKERTLQPAPPPRCSADDIPNFSMAFQPVVNVVNGSTYAYEALVRSLAGESAYSVLSRVPRNSSHLFDMACRSRAMKLAANYGLLNQAGVRLCVNVNPNAAVTETSHLDITFGEAVESGFPLDRLIIELVENEEIHDFDGLKSIVDDYRACGVKIAMDDFGSGYSGLKLLTRLHPDVVKLDMGLISRVETDRVSEVMVKAMVQACFELNIITIAEGVETYDTAMRLRDMGVVYQQGYYFARPGFEILPTVNVDLPEMSIGQPRLKLV